MRTSLETACNFSGTSVCRPESPGLTRHANVLACATVIARWRRYVVQEGELDILVGVRRERVHQLKRGDSFGEVALTAEDEEAGKRTATVVATCAAGVTLLRLGRADFQALVGRKEAERERQRRSSSALKPA